MTDSHTSTTVNLGSASQIPSGEGRCYTVGSREIAVFRQSDGRIFACQNSCPHRQGPLADGILDEAHVICPFHGHTFSLVDGSSDSDGESVEIYAVEIKDGDIVITV